MPFALIACGASDDTAAPGDRPLGAAWAVDSVPALTLGAAVDDTTQLFAKVLGTTRLPNGDVLVVDDQSFVLQFFGANGARLRQTGRKGPGPGEFRSPAYFWRCGDSLIVYDISGYRTSVLTLTGEYVREFRFGQGPTATDDGPYQSACNPGGMFVHYGWADSRTAPPDEQLFRQRVSFWLSGLDSAVAAQLDSFPGSERFRPRRPNGQLSLSNGPGSSAGRPQSRSVTAACSSVRPNARRSSRFD